MITERKLVLVSNLSQEHCAKVKFNFEAITVIRAAGEIERVWRNNKTPLILKKNWNSNQNKYTSLDVPIFNNLNDFVNFCHINGIESGEYITGKKIDTKSEDCFLCRIARNCEKMEEFNATVEDISDMIMYNSDNFFVKIELGCLKKGMVMICPKSHVLSAANIPDEYFEEYLQVMKDVEFILKSIYGNGPVIFFEHGSSPNGFSSHERSIVHAHTHVAWGIQFEQHYLDMVSLTEVPDVRISKNSKYFSYQNGTDGKIMLVNDKEVYVQRQYPRQVIGKMLGIENSKCNWRNEPFYANMYATFQDFYNFLVNPKVILPSRIVFATGGFVKGFVKRKDFLKKD